MFFFLLHFTSASQPRLPLPSWCRLEILIFNFSTFPSSNVFVSLYGSGSRAKRANVFWHYKKWTFSLHGECEVPTKESVVQKGRSMMIAMREKSYKRRKRFLRRRLSETLENLRLPFQSLFQSLTNWLVIRSGIWGNRSIEFVRGKILDLTPTLDCWWIFCGQFNHRGKKLCAITHEVQFFHFSAHNAGR